MKFRNWKPWSEPAQITACFSRGEINFWSWLKVWKSPLCLRGKWGNEISILPVSKLVVLAGLIFWASSATLDQNTQITIAPSVDKGWIVIWIYIVLSHASEVGSPTNPPWAPGSDKTRGQGSFGRLTKGLTDCLVAAWRSGGFLETPPLWHATI